MIQVFGKYAKGTAVEIMEYALGEENCKMHDSVLSEKSEEVLIVDLTWMRVVRRGKEEAEAFWKMWAWEV